MHGELPTPPILTTSVMAKPACYENIRSYWIVFSPLAYLDSLRLNLVFYSWRSKLYSVEFFSLN